MSGGGYGLFNTKLSTFNHYYWNWNQNVPQNTTAILTYYVVTTSNIIGITILTEQYMGIQFVIFERSQKQHFTLVLRICKKTPNDDINRYIQSKNKKKEIESVCAVD